MYENNYPQKRFSITLAFLRKHIGTHEKILDLGVPNPLSDLMQKEGYRVENTTGKDLDDDTTEVRAFEGEVVTAFEILEHLVSPYQVLKHIPCDKVLISVPLRLWFAAAYRHATDVRDQHYHEFESWQLDYVLEKAGWQVKDNVQFTHPVRKLGIRPILRWFTPRYYLVYAERLK